MFPLFNEEKQKDILIQLLKEALINLRINSNINRNTFSEDVKEKYNKKNKFTLRNLKFLIFKIKHNYSLDSIDLSVINKAFIEYIDKLNKSQSQFIYMTEDNDFKNIEEIRQKIKDVYIYQNKFNQYYIELRHSIELNNNIKKTPTYNIETIINALEEAKQFTIHNYKVIEDTFSDVNIEVLKENYLEKNDFVLSLISNTIKSLKNETPLKCNEVSLINAALVKYIQKLETHQSNNLCLLINTNDIKIFRDQIKNIYFEIVKFNDSFLLEKL